MAWINVYSHYFGKSRAGGTAAAFLFFTPQSMKKARHNMARFVGAH